ncbi:hypothetical protein ET495_09995 [Xylanimonas allomyrinae]|uniref:Nuclear transport factor 2 family protein n=1 Tax=Xylanimonas allomyrinae TaxID=2509459 RepID=A0A4P6EP42_9MICO|nr:hypothetical protein [Xylanimonas allomyrinae]QAY63523.1 hypothetical protein ET495_09995 [Xylanimonas allomyrinae]
MRRVGVALAAAVIAMTAVAGCTGSPGSSPVPTPPADTSTTSEPATGAPSPTSAPSPESESEQAAASAEDAVRDFYAVVDELRSDPASDVAALDDVATSIALSSRQRQLERERGDGWHQTGETKIVTLDVKGVDLTNTDADGAVAPVVQFDVCIDVSGVDVLDANGSSVAAAGRPTTGWERQTVVNHDWADDPVGGWRVSTSETLGQQPCEADS